jgi:hypothetical protein
MQVRTLTVIRRNEGSRSGSRASAPVTGESATELRTRFCPERPCKHDHTTYTVALSTPPQQPKITLILIYCNQKYEGKLGDRFASAASFPFLPLCDDVHQSDFGRGFVPRVRACLGPFVYLAAHGLLALQNALHQTAPTALWCAAASNRQLHTRSCFGRRMRAQGLGWLGTISFNACSIGLPATRRRACQAVHDAL